MITRAQIILQQLHEIFEPRAIDPKEIEHRQPQFSPGHTPRRGDLSHTYRVTKEHGGHQYGFEARVNPGARGTTSMTLKWHKGGELHRNPNDPGQTRDALFAMGHTRGLMDHVLKQHKIDTIDYEAAANDKRKVSVYNKFANRLHKDLGAHSTEVDEKPTGGYHGYKIHLTPQGASANNPPTFRERVRHFLGKDRDDYQDKPV